MDNKDLKIGDIVVYFDEFFFKVVSIKDNLVQLEDLFTKEETEAFKSNVEKLTDDFYYNSKQYLLSILDNLEKAYELSKQQ